jgi:hypothetical protein
MTWLRIYEPGKYSLLLSPDAVLKLPAEGQSSAHPFLASILACGSKTSFPGTYSGNNNPSKWSNSCCAILAANPFKCSSLSIPASNPENHLSFHPSSHPWNTKISLPHPIRLF